MIKVSLSVTLHWTHSQGICHRSKHIRAEVSLQILTFELMSKKPKLLLFYDDKSRERGTLSLSMGTHGLRFLRDFFANLRFFQEDLRFSD